MSNTLAANHTPSLRGSMGAGIRARSKILAAALAVTALVGVVIYFQTYIDAEILGQRVNDTTPSVEAAVSGSDTTSLLLKPTALQPHNPGDGLQSLKSGYDDRGMTLFRDRYRELQAATQPQEYQFFHMTQKAWAYGGNRFWGMMATGEWEPNTYEIFNYYIDHATTYVDFGTWVGITLLFGAQLAKRSFGLEADPAAYAECLYNLRLNAGTNWYHRVQLAAAGVGITEGELEMHFTSAGSSGSSFGHFAGERPGLKLLKWSTMCYTLPSLFETWGVEPDNEHVFVKVDVETFECDLLPSWANWLKNYKTKPTLYISMHGQIHDCSEEQYQAIAQIVKTYKYISDGWELTQNQSTVKGHLGEFILSDYAPPPRR